jgi:hypothetical protein
VTVIYFLQVAHGKTKEHRIKNHEHITATRQSGSRAFALAVLQALPPIALGHAAAIALAVVVVGLAQVLVAPAQLRLACASALIGFGIYKLVKRAHPRWVGMRVGFRDLTAWSLLMSTAHGAGLMLVPVLLRVSTTAHAHGAHAEHMAMAGTPTLALGEGLAAVGVHTAAMFLVMAAVVVFEKVGLAILRRAWFNLDLAWAGRWWWQG